MSYSDPKFYSRYFCEMKEASSFGTATASATNGINEASVVVLPAFPRRTKLLNVKLICTVIPDTGSTNVVAHVMNGTATAGTITLTTATAGQVLSATMTEANSTFTSGATPVIKLTGTATASADANGSYAVYFECQELYS